ncbi:MAG: hypothetical protein AAF541_06600 [Pseudomonadota bacterium]
MTIEDQNTNDEVPHVARFLGRAVSEWVTYSLIISCFVAVIFGSMVGEQRDAQAQRAMLTLQALTEAAEKKQTAGHVLVCDSNLLDPEQLANEYLTLSIRQAPIDQKNTSLGYGPALYVSVVEKEVSGDTWATANRLMELVEEAGEREAADRDAKVGRIAPSNASGVNEEPSATKEAEEKPKNRLRDVRKKAYGDNEEYLRYFILASEVAICGQEA